MEGEGREQGKLDKPLKHIAHLLCLTFATTSCIAVLSIDKQYR